MLKLLSKIRLEKDLEYAQKEEFKKTYRQKSTDFTRKRKLTMFDIILSTITRVGFSLKLEIRRYLKMKQDDKTVSKVAYLKQRLKLDPKAFLALNSFHLKNFYNEETARTIKNYLVLAVDGSNITIPTNKETLELYGNSSVPSAKPTAQIGLSCIYDVCNEFILDISINRNNFDERAAAEKNIDNIAEIIEDKAFIVLFDRGYPSIENMLNRFEKGQKFLMRLSSSQFKREQSSMTSDDEIIEIKFDQTRINPYRNTKFAEKLRTVGSMFVRFVRVHLSSGETEYLATNLSQEEFNTKEISDLYFMRWAIETVYDTLKNKLEIENFTGTKPLLIEQDIYATVYLCNIIQDVIRDAEESLKREGKLNKYKHVMTINKNFAIGVMRDELIGFVATDSDVECRILFEKVIKEIQSELIPVRKGRSFNRHKNAKSKRFFNNIKRNS